MQETHVADAIATLHQHDFDAITLSHLSILMQKTMDSRCNSETLALVTANRCEKAIASRAIALARIKPEIDAILSYRIYFGPITSKFSRCNMVKN
jgi:hypothetical protein